MVRESDHGLAIPRGEAKAKTSARFDYAECRLMAQGCCQSNAN